MTAREQESWSEIFRRNWRSAIAVPVLVGLFTTYVPGIVGWLWPGLKTFILSSAQGGLRPLWIIVFLALVYLVAYLYGETRKGRMGRLNRLKDRLKRFEYFGRQQELETISRVLKLPLLAGCIVVLLVFIFMPFALVFSFVWAYAIVAGVVQNLKPETHPMPLVLPFWVSFSFSLLIALSIMSIYVLLDNARWEARMLSPGFRRDMVQKWRLQKKKLEHQLGIEQDRTGGLEPTSQGESPRIQK